MQSEMEQFVLGELEALEKFREHQEIFQTEVWQIIDEMFEQAEEAFLNQFVNNAEENPAAFRKVIKFIKTFRNLPNSVKEAIQHSEQAIEEAEKHMVETQLMAQATEEGVD